MSDYRTLENKIRDIVARPWTKDPKKVHHKLQQIQKKIIDEEPEMLNNKAIGIPDSVIEAAKQINKGKTEVDVNPQYKTEVKDSEDDNKKMKGKSPAAMGIAAAKDDDNERKEYSNKGKKMPSRLTGIRKEEVEELDELDRQQGSIINRYISKTNPDYKSPKEVKKRAPGRALALQKKWGDKNFGTSEPKVKAVTREDVVFSDEEIARLEDINASFSEDAVQSAQKSAQQKMKAASITAKATVQADKIKDQARKQAQNNSYEPEGDMVEEGNLAAQIRDAKPSITGHIEVSVGDKKVKILHRKAQDFLGSYHSKRTPAEKDDHEKAFRKEIGG